MENAIRKIMRSFGFDVIRYKGYTPGRFRFEDMAVYAQTDQPLIMDVGPISGNRFKLSESNFPNP